MPSSKKNERRLLIDFALNEEKEREAIAKKIHSVNTLLSLVKINLKKTERLKADKQKLAQLAGENNAIVEEVMQIISASVRELSPPMFAKIGYVAAMQELCRKASEGGEGSVVWKTEDEADHGFKIEHEIQLYRLSREVMRCLINEVHAPNIYIALHKKKMKYQVRFEHDGKSVDVCSMLRYGLQARLAAAGAQMRCGKKWIEIEVAYGKKN